MFLAVQRIRFQTSKTKKKRSLGFLEKKKKLREMVETSSSSSSKSTRVTCSNVDHHEILISKVIASAIREKSCPICLGHIDDVRITVAVLSICMHVYCIDCIQKWSELKRNCPLCNAQFDSWFFRIRVSARKFEKQRLPKLEEEKKLIGFGNHRRERSSFPYQRSLNRSRDELLHTVHRRSRPVPVRRSFGRPRYVPNSERQHQEEIVAERILRWRASVYNQRLQAIPFTSRICREKNTLGSNGMKERVQRRVEPWIARELQAILGDSDPSVIVHVATSLYVLRLEEKLKDPTSLAAREENFIEPLRRFLHDRTNMFWHELRCFDESSLAMEIYDTVVEYKQQEEMQNGE